MEKKVVKHYNEIPPVKSQTANIPITIDHSFSDTGYAKVMTQSEKNKLKGLFTFFYNHYHFEYATQLNYRIPLNQFINSAMQYGRSTKVSEKLKGKELELMVEQLPRNFMYHTDEKNYLLLFTSSKIYIEPGKEDVKVSYTLKENGLPVKTGRVKIIDPNKMYSLTYFQSWWGAVNDYLTAYDNYYKNLGRQVLDKIMGEL